MIAAYTPVECCIVSGTATMTPAARERHRNRLLELKAESVPGSAKGSEASQQVLRTLVTTVQSLAELRNELGIGHGQSTRSVALPRHARLALNATVTIAEFVLDTWQSRVSAGRLDVND